MCVKLSWLNIEIGLRPIKLILGPDMGRQFSTQSLNLVAAGGGLKTETAAWP